MVQGVTEYLAAAGNYNSGDMAWVITATIFCWAIVPGIGLLYSGYTNRRNGLATVWTSFCVLACSSISFMLMGYSIAYGEGNSFIGDASYFGLKGVMEDSVVALPALLYFLFQLVFCVATVAIFMGGAAERASLHSLPVISFFWPLVVYCIVAHWTWAANGWLYTLGALDFAGGSPVHISSGAAAAAFSFYLSHPLFRSRRSKSRSLRVCVQHRPHNMLQLTLAIILIWSGWLAFDGASTLALNLRAAVAATTTHLSGCMGAIVWSLLEYLETKRWSLAAFVSGAIAGLVAITPGCGYVDPQSSLAFGTISSLCCFYFCKIKKTEFAQRIGYFDPTDVVGVHWLGGVIGNCLTGIFAQGWVAATDGVTEIPGGWLSGNFVQLGYQIADCCATTLWAFVITYLLVALTDCVPGLEVLATDDEISKGLDAAHLGESYYEPQWADEEKQLYPEDNNVLQDSDSGASNEKSNQAAVNVKAV